MVLDVDELNDMFRRQQFTTPQRTNPTPTYKTKPTPKYKDEDDEKRPTPKYKPDDWKTDYVDHKNKTPEEQKRFDDEFEDYMTNYMGIKKGKGKPKRTSNWIEHVKTTMKNENCSYKEAMKRGKSTYKK